MLGNLSDLDLKSLRVFCTIVEAGGFTAAQTILNTGLPRLSILVRDLEERLGTKLCHRGRQGFQLTEEGLAVYEAARVLFSDVSRFLDSVGALSGQPAARLSLGIVDGLLSYPGSPIVTALRQFRESSASTHLTLHVMSPDALEKAVLDGELALAIGAFHRRLSGLVYSTVFPEDQQLYCGKGHPLSTASSIGLMEAIAAAPYVERGYMVESSKPRHIAFNRQATAFSMEAILAMLLTGTYIGYLPSHYAQRWVDDGALWSISPAAFAYSSLFSVITRQGKQADRTTQLMLDSLVAHRQDGSALPG